MANASNRPTFVLRWLVLLLLLFAIAPLPAVGQNATPAAVSTPIAGATPTAEATPGWSHFKGDSARRGEANFGPVDQPVELWRHQANGPCAPNPAVAGDTVYAPCDDGTLYALDANTGEVRWTFQGEPFWEIAVAGDLAYVLAGPGTLYAVDIATGQELWRYDAKELATSPAVADGLVVAGTPNGQLVGIDAATGEERWRYQVTTGGGVRPPALLDGVAYVGSETGDFTAIDSESGELIWTVDTGENATGTATVADGIAYIGTAADDRTGSLAAYVAATGQLLWRRDDPMHTPSISAGAGYSGSADGTVYAFDTATGDERWRIQVGGVARPLAVAGDILYIPSDGDRTVYAVDTATGAELWHVAVDGGINGSISVTDGRVFVATMSGVIQAFGESEQGIDPGLPSASPAATPTATPESPAYATPAVTGMPDATTGATVEFLWQSTGNPNDPLWVPLSTAFDPNGNLWVTDAANNRFQIFSPDGEHLETWGTSGDGEGEFNFNNHPGDPGGSWADIAFASDGSFYIADSANRRVQQFAADRTFVQAWGSFGTGDGQFSDPIGIAVAPNGNIYVIDDRRDDIQVFDPDGTYLFAFGGHGTGPGQLNFVGSLAITAGGTVSVADFGNNRIQQYATDGTFLTTIGEFGTGDGQFNGPSDVAVDQFGYLYVSDTGGGRIQVFNEVGEFMTSWNAADDGQGTFTVPIGIAADGEGGVYVTDVVAGTVQKFQATFPNGPQATPAG
jgi:outer membrane protein assembly factor BamB